MPWVKEINREKGMPASGLAFLFMMDDARRGTHEGFVSLIFKTSFCCKSKVMPFKSLFRRKLTDFKISPIKTKVSMGLVTMQSELRRCEEELRHHQGRKTEKLQSKFQTQTYEMSVCLFAPTYMLTVRVCRCYPINMVQYLQYLCSVEQTASGMYPREYC